MPATESASVFTKSRNPRRGENGIYLLCLGTINKPVVRVVRALEAATLAPESGNDSRRCQDEYHLSYSGLLATGGSLVFGGRAWIRICVSIRLLGMRCGESFLEAKRLLRQLHTRLMASRSCHCLPADRSLRSGCKA